MRVFRMNNRVHVFNLFSIVLCLSTLLLSKLGLETVVAIPVILTLFACFNFANMLVTKYIIDGKSIIYKTLLSRIEMKWEDVECVLELPAGIAEKVSVGLISKNKRIIVTALVKDYQQLIMMTKEESEKRDSIKIDPKFEELSM